MTTIPHSMEGLQLRTQQLGIRHRGTFPKLVAEFYSTHPGAPHHIRRALFDYISFRSSLEHCAGLSLPRRGGDVRGPPISAQLRVQLRSCKHNSSHGCTTPTPEMQLRLHLRTHPLATRLFASPGTVQSLLMPTWHI
jgi:hypothetical protein